MRLSCPECGATGSFAQFAADTDARIVCERLAGMSSAVGMAVLRYLGLFRPGKRGLSWPRSRRLLDDLAEMMASPAINRRGRDWPVNAEMWRQALEQIVEQRAKLTLPLKSHGYLLEILAGLADKAQASAEDQREAELRQGLKQGVDAPVRRTRQNRIDTAIASENATRKRLKLEPLTADEMPAFLQREGLA